MGYCVEPGPDGKLPVQKLFWARSNYRYEDGFIVAPNKYCARYFLHECEPDRLVWARYICDLPHLEPDGCADWADLDLLVSLGYKVIHRDHPYVVWKDGELFRRGSDFEDPIISAAGRRPGVYVVRLRSTRFFKIGNTTNLRARFLLLRRTIPKEIELVWFFPTPFATDLEREAHWHVRERRHSCEWFILKPKEFARIMAFLSIAREYDHEAIYQRKALRALRVKMDHIKADEARKAR